MLCLTLDRTMSTYTSNWTTFEIKARSAASLIPVVKLGIGLEDDTTRPIPEAELKARVALIQSLGVKEIDVWQAEIPYYWMPALRKFAAEA